MLTVSQVSKSFGGRILFQDASLQVNRGERLGLVGPNGAGKSTLFSLLLGQAAPDEGRISREKGATVGFLPQESAPVGDETVLGARARDHAGARRARGRSCCAHEAGEAAHATEESEDEYHEAMRVFAEADGYQIEARAKRILHGLAFREARFRAAGADAERRLDHARAPRAAARAGARSAAAR